VISEDDRSALQKAFDSLYTDLNDAYWAASTTEAKDKIHGAKDLVSQVLDELDQAESAANSTAMASLAQSLNSSIKDLSNLQKELDQIVHNVAAASTALQAIDKALIIGGKVAAAL
jgi:chromosome segregation ATPase